MPRRLAWLLWSITVAQVAAALALGALNGLDAARLFAEYVASLVLGAVAFATVGALIVERRGRNAIGWLYCALGVGFAWSAGLSQYARYALVTAPDSLPGAQLAGWLNLWTGVPVLLTVVLILPLVFPDGRLPSPRWRPLAWLAAVAIVLFATTWALNPGPIDTSQPDVPNPFAPPNATRILEVLAPVAYALTLVALIGAVSAVVARARGATQFERQQLTWFAYGVSVLLTALLVPIVLGIAVFRNFPGDTLLSGVLVSVGFPAVPLATGVAILKHRLYEIDRLINRTLVYATLTACILAIYGLAVGYLSSFFRAEGNTLVPLVATGVVAVVFEPLRARLQRGVDRLLYGDRDAPYRALAQLGSRLQATLAPDQVFEQIIATVRHAVGGLAYVALAVEGESGEAEVVAAMGMAPTEPLRLPLVYQGETVGHLLVARHDVDAKWSAQERAVLETFASQASAAVHAVRLTARLQHAREQLVLAREEERRRLRHDLHDELAPTLAGLSLTAATASDLLTSDPAAARALVADLHAALRASVGEVRRVAHDLRPPVLDELGLLASIRERARQFDTAAGADEGLHVRLDAPDELPSLPAAVEVAAYRIVSEALLNVVRHANAKACTIELRVCEEHTRRLRVEISDDGAGLPADGRVGVGLRSMRERVAELGGSFLAGPRHDGGGTRIVAELPFS